MIVLSLGALSASSHYGAGAGPSLAVFLTAPEEFAPHMHSGAASAGQVIAFAGTPEAVAATLLVCGLLPCYGVAFSD